jgi:transketolase
MNVAKTALREDRRMRADALRMLASDRVHGPARGGYVLADSDAPKILLIASGDEIAVARRARDRLAARGVAARVIAMPSTALFDRQDAAYRRAVLLKDVRRIAIEAGPTKGWWKYVGFDGAVVCIKPMPVVDRARHVAASADRVTEIALFLTRTEV